MAKKYSRSYKRLAWRYDALVEVAHLNRNSIEEFWEGDEDVLRPSVKGMIDHVVRGEVLVQYVFVDLLLGQLLLHHMFGRAETFTRAKRTQRFRTFKKILGDMYLLPKLAAVREFMEVPKSIASSIGALNDLRNGLAHTFETRGLPENKKKYRGRRLDMPEGLSFFLDDMYKVTSFLDPSLAVETEAALSEPSVAVRDEMYSARTSGTVFG